MAGMAGKRIGMLSARKVKTSKGPAFLGDGGNLYLSVDVANNKSWIFRWRAKGKFEKCGLGALHTVSLAEARDKAADCRNLVAAGKDPRVVRRAEL